MLYIENNFCNVIINNCIKIITAELELRAKTAETTSVIENNLSNNFSVD